MKTEEVKQDNARNLNHNVLFMAITSLCTGGWIVGSKTKEPMTEKAKRMTEVKHTQRVIPEGGIKAIDLCGIYKDQRFKLAKGRVVWEALSWKGNRCFISRVVENGGKPLFLGLNYISRYIDPDTIVFPINVCPICFDPECTSDHK